MKSVAIVGAGIAGLCAAWELDSLDDVEVDLFESAAVAGGKIRSKVVNGFVLDLGADGFLAGKAEGVQLCREMGLEPALIDPVAVTPRSFIRSNNELHPLPAGFSGLVPGNLDALRESPILSAAGRKRALAEPEQPARIDDGDESISEFFTRRFGAEAFSRLIEPLVSGIFGGDADHIGVLAAFPQLREMERTYGSLVRGADIATEAPKGGRRTFVSFAEGMEELPRAVARTLRRNGRTKFRSETPVTSLRLADDRFELKTRLAVEQFDATILAVPSPVAADLLQGICGSAAGAVCQELRGIRYASSTIVHLGYRSADLDPTFAGHGYLVPAAEPPDTNWFRACTVSSRKWAGRSPKDFELVRLYLRTPRDPGPSDSAIVSAARQEMERTFGVTAEPVLADVHHWDASIPQYDVGHRERIARIESALLRLNADGAKFALCGAPYYGVGIPDCIRSGRKAAGALKELL